jgi:hypothetical protein
MGHAIEVPIGATLKCTHALTEYMPKGDNSRRTDL